jgi:sarcosine oxidase, subunit beta
MTPHPSAPPPFLTPTPEVLVVGGGIVGAATAWQMARLGIGPILVVDRGHHPGSGTTGRATGGFRALFGTAINVQLSLLSRPFLEVIRAETGIDPDFEAVGYLFLAQEAETLAALEGAARILAAHGGPEVRTVTAAEAEVLNPALDAEGSGVVGGVFSSGDGTLRPTRLLEAYRAGAQALGVRFVDGAEVRELTLEGGRITQVALTGGGGEVPARLSPRWVVNAAGPWAAPLAQMAGVELPVRPMRRQVAVTHPLATLPGAMPLTIFTEDGAHLRRWTPEGGAEGGAEGGGGRAFLLRPDPVPPEDPWLDTLEPGWAQETLRILQARIPVLSGATLDPTLGRAGLYEMSPDGHALLGVAPGCDNLLLANGSSGHGVMHAGALGLLLAETVAYGAPRSLDATALRPSRFQEGDPIRGPSLL